MEGPASTAEEAEALQGAMRVPQTPPLGRVSHRPGAPVWPQSPHMCVASEVHRAVSQASCLTLLTNLWETRDPSPCYCRPTQVTFPPGVGGALSLPACRAPLVTLYGVVCRAPPVHCCQLPHTAPVPWTRQTAHVGAPNAACLDWGTALCPMPLPSPAPHPVQGPLHL